jgi:dTDP-4-amino-4,6-dideoxygalactose transaminase
VLYCRAVSGNPVPFIDLAAPHRALEPEILDALLPLLRSAAFIGGDPVRRFEHAFAELHGSPHAVTTKSGTSALILALKAMGVGPGDEVIVPAFTFIATAAAVALVGATPVFVDVDPETACLVPDAVGLALTQRTRAVIPVHLYGHPASMTELLALARDCELKVLEDCAQSHLATWQGRMTGTLGDAAAFSFYPTKNLGAAGDAGAVLTSDPDLATRIRQLANHGRSEHTLHVEIGENERLDAIQAAVLSVKLRHLPEWTESRRRLAARYRERLQGSAPWGEPLRLPVERPDARHVYHLFTVRHSRRDAIAAALREAGIGTAIHYPLTVPAQPAFRDRVTPARAWPEAERWAATCLSLPLYPELTEDRQDRVIACLQAIR